MHAQRSNGSRALGWAVAPLLGCHAALLAVSYLPGHALVWIGLEAAAFVALAWACRRLRGLAWGARTLLLVGALLRALVLPLPLALSDDAYRYLWDGRVTLAGHDPWALPPDASQLAPLRDRLWQQVAHRDVPTVYPPAAIGLFSIASASPLPLPTLKAMLALVDLAGAFFLLRLAKRTGAPRERVLWYAWNPLVVLEGAGMAHVDVAAAAAAIAAVTLLAGAASERRGRAAAWCAGLAAAAGVLLKLVPAFAVPVWARWARSRSAFLVAAFVATAVGSLPMLARPGVVPPGLVRYGVSWEFDGPLFEPLWRVLDACDADELVKHGLDHIKQVGYRSGNDWSGLNHVYPYVYPQLLAKAVLAVAFLGVLLCAATARDLVAASQRVFGGFLLASATVYPWYAVWVLPWAALRGAWPWLLLSGTLLFSYLPRTLVTAFPGVYLLVWAPFAIGSLVWLWRRHRGNTA